MIELVFGALIVLPMYFYIDRTKKMPAPENLTDEGLQSVLEHELLWIERYNCKPEASRSKNDEIKFEEKTHFVESIKAEILKRKTQQISGSQNINKNFKSPELQRTFDLLAAIDAGGVPLYLGRVNDIDDIARKLGLEVAMTAPVEEMIERIQAAVTDHSHDFSRHQTK